MLLQITHETRYAYQPPVETAQHMAYLHPKVHAAQDLLSHSLIVSPQPAQQRDATDVYGNTRCFFSLQVPHDELSVVAHSLVHTKPQSALHSSIGWEQLAERFRYRAGATFDPAAEFVFASPYAPRHSEFAAYARPSFVAKVSAFDVATHLMQRIHEDFTYESMSTQVNTPALEALANRTGVCQDFAHIMIACWRAMGLPARYVSGYLLTEPMPGTVKLVGSDASHAWVSIYLPDLPEGARWCDFDPTNNRAGWHAPGEDYVTVATGRDFGDVSPLRGVIHGGAKHTLTVGVTVQCLDDRSSTPAAETLHESEQPSQSQSQSQSGSQSQSVIRSTP